MDPVRPNTVVGQSKLVRIIHALRYIRARQTLRQQRAQQIDNMIK
jgi:hypothetical protein